VRHCRQRNRTRAARTLIGLTPKNERGFVDASVPSPGPHIELVVAHGRTVGCCISSPRRPPRTTTLSKRAAATLPRRPTPRFRRGRREFVDPTEHAESKIRHPKSLETKETDCR